MSSEIAYSVGLMVSDGCLSRDGRHIDLTSKDTEQLNNFCQAMNRNLPISKKFNGMGMLAYRVQFSDVAFYDFLLEIGLTPAKSRTIAKLKIPDKLYPDFLRGLFDGDGCTYGYMDPRWKSSFMFYVCFTSGSIEFINYLRKTTSRLSGVAAGSIRHGHRAYTLAYAKADSHNLYKCMYYEDDLLSLSRKRIKLNSYVLKDQADIIANE